MPSIVFTADTTGYPKVFQQLKPALQRRVLRRTLQKSMAPMARAYRRNLKKIRSPQSTGALAQGIRSFSRTTGGKLIVKGPKAGTRSKLGDTFAAVGGRRATAPRALRTPSGGMRLVYRRPSAYLHLADGGTRLARGYNFRLAAIREAEPAVKRIIQTDLLNQIDKATQAAIRSQVKKLIKGKIRGAL